MVARQRGHPPQQCDAQRFAKAARGILASGGARPAKPCPPEAEQGLVHEIVGVLIDRRASPLRPGPLRPGPLRPSPWRAARGSRQAPQQRVGVATQSRRLVDDIGFHEAEPAPRWLFFVPCGVDCAQNQAVTLC
jgi:hypothetical protein